MICILICVSFLVCFVLLGSLFVEVNECFVNAVKCSNFRSESIKKGYELIEGKVDYGKVTIVFSVSKNIGNSNRHRSFYTEATLATLDKQAV
jgi:hypothetical protein